MGLLDSLRGGGDSDSSDGIDGFRVMKNTPKGGWKPVEGFDDMDEPIAKDTFQYNASPLEPGNYRLFAVKDNLNQQPPDGTGWTLEVDGSTKDADQDGEIASLKREIRAMREEGSQQEPTDPQEAVEMQKASLQLAALQSDDFLKRHGEKIVLAMFGDEGGGGGNSGRDGKIQYDDWQKNPVGASLYETMNMVREEPEQIERLGQAIGRGVGTFVGSAADGYTEGDGDLSLEEAREQAGADADPEPDEQPAGPAGGRDLDGGPSDLGELSETTGRVDTEDLAADLAEARTNIRRSGAGEQDRPEDAPGSSTPDPDAGADPDADDAGGDPVATAAEATADPPADPPDTDAASPDPDPMTASPDDSPTTDREGSSDERAAAIAEEL